MRDDTNYISMYEKERNVTNYLSACHEFLAWEFIGDRLAQAHGVDLSCTSHGKPVFLDFKLKNSSSLNEKSEWWSVEILKTTPDDELLDGWFADPESWTNLYGFQDAFGKSWRALSSVEVTYVSKKTLKEKVERIAHKTLAEIKSDAEDLIHSPYKDQLFYCRDSLDTRLKLKCSSPDGNGRKVVNLVFHRSLLDGISKKSKH